MTNVMSSYKSNNKTYSYLTNKSIVVPLNCHHNITIRGFTFYIELFNKKYQLVMPINAIEVWLQNKVLNSYAMHVLGV